MLSRGVRESRDIVSGLPAGLNKGMPGWRSTNLRRAWISEYRFHVVQAENMVEVMPDCHYFSLRRSFFVWRDGRHSVIIWRDGCENVKGRAMREV